jgi:hypothetical protein
MSTKFCFICGINQELTKHHIMPKAAGGLNAKSNLVVLCQVCHTLVERYYWEHLAGLKPDCAAYYVAIIKALREGIVHSTAVEEALRRLKLAHSELLKINPSEWPKLFTAACAWINTIQITKAVKMSTHNFILEEPWWIQK